MLRAPLSCVSLSIMVAPLVVNIRAVATLLGMGAASVLDDGCSTVKTTGAIIDASYVPLSPVLTFHSTLDSMSMGGAQRVLAEMANNNTVVLCLPQMEWVRGSHGRLLLKTKAWVAELSCGPHHCCHLDMDEATCNESTPGLHLREIRLRFSGLPDGHDASLQLSLQSKQRFCNYLVSHLKYVLVTQYLLSRTLLVVSLRICRKLLLG